MEQSRCYSPGTGLTIWIMQGVSHPHSRYTHISLTHIYKDKMEQNAVTTAARGSKLLHLP